MTSDPVQRTTTSEVTRLRDNRWLILFFSVVSMVAVANFQYGWTLFVPPLQKHLGVDRATIQVTFTVFVLLETWLVPFEGWLVDRFGPRLLVMLGGLFAGLGWVLSGNANTVTELYLSYALAGVGAGVVYGTAIGSALPDSAPAPHSRSRRSRTSSRRPDIRRPSSSGESSRGSSSSSPRSSFTRRRRAGCPDSGPRWTPGTT
jgi:hypothetical protein